MHLAGDQRRADADAAVIDRHEVAHGDLARLPIDLDHRDVRAERIEELRDPEEVRRLETRLDPVGQLVAVGVPRDLGEGETP